MWGQRKTVGKEEVGYGWIGSILKQNWRNQDDIMALGCSDRASRSAAT
jgi:hypothetical protein